MSAFSSFFRGVSDDRHSRAYPASDDVHSFDTGFDPGDRIGAPLRPPRTKALRRRVLFVAMLGIGGATYYEPAIWSRAWTLVAPVGGWLAETVQSPSPATPNAPPKAEPLPSPLAPPTVAPAADFQVRDIAPLPPVAIVAEPAQDPKADTSAPPADRATARVLDPLQKRAEAAGLHPDLSVALLKRLTDADFKAAATAIRKALADLRDDGTLVWPDKPSPTAALFRVSFVQGAPADCRRYIVAIAKDGWQTTALPVEKCGSRDGGATPGPARKIGVAP